MSVEPSLILGFVAGATGSMLLWVTVGKRIIMRYAGTAVINRIKDPDEETKEAIWALLDEASQWLVAERPTGKTVQVEVPGADGKPVVKNVEERIAPLTVFANHVGELAVSKIRMSILSGKGVDARKRQMLEERLQEDLLQGGPLAEKLGGLLPSTMKAIQKEHPLGAALLQMLGPDFLKGLIGKKTILGAGESTTKTWES